MTQAIIFDVGGVYMSGSFVDFVSRSYTVLDIDQVFTASDEITFDANLNTGKISHDECFRKYFGVSISEDQMEQIKEIWMTTWAPTQNMIDLVRKLKNTYTLAILSNSDLLNSTKYSRKGWYSYFDHLILSHEVGILKPDPMIYEMTLERIGLPARECLFIDDQAKVLVPARDIGMETIHFQSLEQLKRELIAKNIVF